jgi:hypothetical protein
MRRRRTLLLLLAGPAVALPRVSGSAAATCLPGQPPGVPCLPVEAPPPAPSPSLGTSPSPSPSPTSETTTTDEPASTDDGGEGLAPAPALDTGTLPGPALGDSGTAPLPDTAPTDGGILPGSTPAGPAPETAGEEQAPITETRINPVAAFSSGSVAQSVSGAFAIVLGVLLMLPLLLAALANHAARTMYAGPGRAFGPVLRAGPVGAVRAPTRQSRADVSTERLSSAGLPADVASAVAAAIAEAITTSLAAVAPATTTRQHTRTTTTSSRSYDRPGAPVNPTATNRLYLGLGALAVAALAGFIGWYQLSGNPNVNQQLPYLASAGVIVVIASAIGGALLVGDQLRGDDRRIEELEDAVRELAAALSPRIEAPARGPAREIAHGGYGGALDTEVLDDEAAPVTRRVRTARTAARQHD